MTVAVLPPTADRLRIARRAAVDSDGFGLVEMLIALMVLNIGVFATVAAFNSGTLALRRANRTATASVIADKQMELYRSLLYSNITVLAPPAPCDATYCGDTEYAGSVTSPTCPTGVPAAACQPISTVAGPDGNNYRVDTYVHLSVQSTGAFPGRAVKVIAIVVRNPKTMASIVRTSSTFDKAAGT